MDASALTRQRRARAIYASVIAMQQRIAGGCVSFTSLPHGGGGSDVAMGVVEGAVFTTQAEHDNIIALSTCPPNTTPPTAPSVITVSVPNSYTGTMAATGNITSDGGAAITARGFVYNTTGAPTLSSHVHTDGGTALGVYVDTFSPYTFGVLLYVSAYATNAIGTTYGNVITATIDLCIAKGTPVTLANGTRKPIEAITTDDDLLVWDFDNGQFTSALPLWIKKAQTTTEYNMLEFSDGTILKTIGQHRIFNRERGAFTYPMSADTPIGTHTFNEDGHEVTLAAKSVVTEPVDYYNVITDYHMNLFANGILTSCRYNNIYPIVDMQFVKNQSSCTWVSRSTFEGVIPDKYYKGLRLAEQTIPVRDTIWYVRRLEQNTA